MPDRGYFDEGTHATQPWIGRPVWCMCRWRQHSLDRVGCRDRHLRREPIVDDPTQVECVHVGMGSQPRPNLPGCAREDVDHPRGQI